MPYSNHHHNRYAVTTMKLSKHQIAKLEAEAATLLTPDTPTPDASEPAPTISFEIAHNVTSNPAISTLHILILPPNRVTASRYTTLDSIPDSYMTTVEAALLAFMRTECVTVTYAPPKYTRNAKNMRGMFTKAHLAVTRKGVTL
jgi:hypothetical protein